MNKKLYIEDYLLTELSFSEIETALDKIDQEYWLEVTIDDMYDINIATPSHESYRFIEIELDEYDNIVKKSFSDILEMFDFTGYGLAQATGLGQSTIAQYVSGERNIKNASIDTFIKIAGAFQVSVDFLFNYIKD